MQVRLSLSAASYAVCRLDPQDATPSWPQGEIVSVTRTREELSIVCPVEFVPDSVTCERDWRALRVDGKLDFSLVGVIASLTTPLAAKGVSVFVLSTFDTDYLLVKQADLPATTAALTEAGHQLRGVMN